MSIASGLKSWACRRNKRCAEPGVVLPDIGLQAFGNLKRAMAMMTLVGAHLPVQTLLATHCTGGRPGDVWARFGIRATLTNQANSLAAAFELASQFCLRMI